MTSSGAGGWSGARSVYSAESARGRSIPTRFKSFSHALGTVRMGVDDANSPLDGDCRLRGVRNLLVVDGSALPTAAAVNPALTIAANALRAADRLVNGGGR